MQFLHLRLARGFFQLNLSKSYKNGQRVVRATCGVFSWKVKFTREDWNISRLQFARICEIDHSIDDGLPQDKMKRGEGCFMLTSAVFLLLLRSSLVSSDGSLHNITATANATDSHEKVLLENLNATVSKVIESFEENSFRGDSVVEQSGHVKKAKIVARKGVDMNMTTSVATSAPIVGSKESKGTEAQPHKEVDTLIDDKAGGHSATTVAGNATIDAKATTHNGSTVNAVTSSPASTSTTTSSSSTTTTASTSSTTTSTTTTTTTKPPRKPKVTYSVDDEPKLLQAAKPGYNSPSTAVSDVNGRLHVEEPMVELSKEYIAPPRGHREYVVPVVTLIFAIPLLMGLFLLSYRRAKEFWLTRHYRRMDFLVDGMYNY